MPSSMYIQLSMNAATSMEPNNEEVYTRAIWTGMHGEFWRFIKIWTFLIALEWHNKLSSHNELLDSRNEMWFETQKNLEMLPSPSTVKDTSFWWRTLVRLSTILVRRCVYMYNRRQASVRLSGNTPFQNFFDYGPMHALKVSLTQLIDCLHVLVPIDWPALTDGSKEGEITLVLVWHMILPTRLVGCSKPCKQGRNRQCKTKSISTEAAWPATYNHCQQCH